MITIKAIGSIVSGNSHFLAFLAGKPIVIPEGYTMERAVWENPASEARKKASAPHVVLAYKDGAATGSGEVNEVDPAIPRFQATVEPAEAGQPPRITVVRSDDPASKRYTSSKSHTAAWREALLDAAKDFPDKPTSESKTPHGLRLMGLHLAEVVAEISALEGGAAAFAAAEADMAARKADTATVVDDAVSVQSTPGVTVTGSKAGQKRSKAAQATATTTTTTAAETTAATAGTTTARRRRKTEAASNTTTTAPTSAAAPVHVVCPDCGLAGTPFCATTGKPHEAAPCPKCGLTSAFCPVTGEAHTGAIQRVNRERGEVHLPGTRRRAAKKTAEATIAEGAGGTAELALTVDGTPVKKARRKRSTEETTTAEAGADAEGATTKKRRTRSTAATTAATTAEADGMRQATIAETVPEPSLLDIALKDPDVYIYPTLRPPLTQAEQRRAQHCVDQKWQEKGSEPILPVSAQALVMPLVPTKRRATAATTTTTATATRAKKGKATGPKQEANADDGQDGDEGEDHVDGSDRHNGASVGEAADETLLVHPLEVRDVTTSASGKRLAKFLWQYMSERSKFDLLRTQNAAASGKPAASGSGGAVDKAGEASTTGPVKTEALVTEDASTQAMSDRQRSDSQTDAAAVAAEVLKGTSEMTLPRVESV